MAAGTTSHPTAPLWSPSSFPHACDLPPPLRKQSCLQISFTLTLFWPQASNYRPKAQDKEQDVATHQRLKGTSPTDKEDSIEQETAASWQKEDKKEQGGWSYTCAWTHATASSEKWRWQKDQDAQEEERCEGFRSWEEGEEG